MEIKLFCRGSKKLAVKYRYYMKYNIMVALCLIAPICLFLLDYFKIIQMAKLRLSSFIVAVILLAWLIILIIGFMGFGSVNTLRYQIFGITTDNQIIHFYFKEMLRDGKVVLHFKPYHKKETKREFIDVIKKKEEIMKDENFEEYLCTLCNDEEVQKQSDILLEVMNDIKIIRETKRYVEVSYTIGQFKTKKKLKIHKNVKHLDELLALIKEKEPNEI